MSAPSNLFKSSVCRPAISLCTYRTLTPHRSSRWALVAGTTSARTHSPHILSMPAVPRARTLSVTLSTPPVVLQVRRRSLKALSCELCSRRCTSEMRKRTTHASATTNSKSNRALRCRRELGRFSTASSSLSRTVRPVLPRAPIASTRRTTSTESESTTTN